MLGNQSPLSLFLMKTVPQGLDFKYGIVLVSFGGGQDKKNKLYCSNYINYISFLVSLDTCPITTYKLILTDFCSFSLKSHSYKRTAVCLYPVQRQPSPLHVRLPLQANKPPLCWEVGVWMCLFPMRSPPVCLTGWGSGRIAEHLWCQSRENTERDKV